MKRETRYLSYPFYLIEICTLNLVDYGWKQYSIKNYLFNNREI